MITACSWRGALAASAVVLSAAPASAQLDPLLYLKPQQPNIIFLVDTSNRMQRDAPADPSTTATAVATSNYYDPFLYARTGQSWETTLGINAGNTTTTFRRLYRNLNFVLPNVFTTSTIQITGDQQSGYASFEAPTRLSVARASIYQAIQENSTVARFGLLRMRQNGPALPGTAGNVAPVTNTDLAQSGLNATDNTPGTWKVTRMTVAGSNGAATTTGLMVHATVVNSAASVLSILSHDVRGSSANSLVPAGSDSDDPAQQDAPVKKLLDDASTELGGASGIMKTDPPCRNTVAVLIVGGGEGTTAGNTNTDLAAAAASFLSIQGHRVPIYVIAIAPPQTDVGALKAVATASGGQYFEVTKAMIDAALVSPYQPMTTPVGTHSVPEMVNAINIAVQHAFVIATDMNVAPTGQLPFGVSSEFQSASPIIGTVNLKGAKDAGGATLTPDPDTVKDRQNNVLPQRSNVIVSTAFTLPGFDMRLRAFRLFKPVADLTQQTGWKFVADGTTLWTACAPGTKVANTSTDCVSGSNPSQRNLFTALPDGSMLAFTTANVAVLAPMMNLTVADATATINTIRSLPLGALLDSTPAIVNPPSLDPPPDNTYPAFAVANKNRRTMVFVGTNRGILEAIDGRTGKEVWGFIPLNLLPKLATLRDGQPIGSFDFFVDSSPKVADVKLSDGSWHTYLVIGEGAGGTFYQTFDVTLANMAASVGPTDDTVSNMLSYFNAPTRIPLKWTYPLYSNFDPTFRSPSMLYGDLASTATPTERTVGQTWSDPAVGQVGSNASPYVVLVGSGFLKYTTQQQTNRGGDVAGTTFYMFDINTGALLDTRKVLPDGLAETVDDCVAVNNCTVIKDALQSDPVATGPADSRFITKAYIGDLDGRVWRFDIQLDPSNKPQFVGSPVKLYEDTSQHQPIYSSMASVNVGGTQQYIFFGTGSDLMPSNGIAESFKLIGVLDLGSIGTVTFNPILLKVDNAGFDEKVSTFPAVAGDIVFFTTTTFAPNQCTPPSANLYALTFIGGAAYDTNNDNKFTSQDKTLVKTFAGVRATAPFIVDQHLVLGTGMKVEIFGDPLAYNNGLGQAGVRILSWREVR